MACLLALGYFVSGSSPCFGKQGTTRYPRRQPRRRGAASPGVILLQLAYWVSALFNPGGLSLMQWFCIAEVFKCHDIIRCMLLLAPTQMHALNRHCTIVACSLPH